MNTVCPHCQKSIEVEPAPADCEERARSSPSDTLAKKIALLHDDAETYSSLAFLCTALAGIGLGVAVLCAFFGNVAPIWLWAVLSLLLGSGFCFWFGAQLIHIRANLER